MRSFLDGADVALVILAVALVSALAAAAWRIDHDATANAREQFEIEAVQHGAARWIVDDEGRREFVWNEGAGDAE